MSWKDDLLPASFRGVPFQYEDTEREGGRRGPDLEFPLRDDGYSEDLGAKRKKHKITGYVIGDDYMSLRENLEVALDGSGPGTLVHPYRGQLTGIVRSWTSRELREKGRTALFTFEFVESGGQPSPESSDDTAGDSIDAADDVYTQSQISFSNDWTINGATLGGATSLLGNLEGALGALISFPGVVTIGFAGLVLNLAGSVNDSAAIGLAVTGFCGAYAIAAYSSIAPVDPTLSSRGPDLTADPTFGLSGLAAWGYSLPAAGDDQSGENQSALVALVASSASAAMAQVFANTSFSAQDDADTARSDLCDLIESVSTTVANSGDNDAFAALEALYSAAGNDLTIRTKQAPSVIEYKLGDAMPALALAQRFYQDPTRAAELIARNAAPHPLFIGPVVEALTS